MLSASWSRRLKELSWHFQQWGENAKAHKGSWIIKFSASESPLDCKHLWHGQSQVGHCQNLREEKDTEFDWQNCCCCFFKQRPDIVEAVDKMSKNGGQTHLSTEWHHYLYEKDKHQRMWCWVTKNSPSCHCGTWNPWLRPHWLRHRGVVRAPRTPAAHPAPDHRGPHSAWEVRSPPETEEDI